MEYITKRRKAADEAAETTSSARRTLLGSAAGTATGAPLRSVDPVFQIASCFTERFDALGKQNAAKMSEVTEKRTDDCEECRNITKQPGAEELRKQHDSPEYVHSASELRDGNFTDRFSEYAFRGGKLAASVMAGQGKQMFTVCLARAIGKPMPFGERQKKLLGESRIRMPVPNMSSDVTFNRDVSSVVGIVTDTMRGSTRILDLFRSLVEDSGQCVCDPLEMRRIGTLRQTISGYWIRAEEPYGNENVNYPSLCMLQMNAVDIMQQVSVSGERSSVRAGIRNQTVQLLNTPVTDCALWVSELSETPLSELQELYRAERENVRTVSGDDGLPAEWWVRWQRVESLASCGPEDRCYELDCTTGRITFGDGVNGRIPAYSAEIQVSADYSWGGGISGNLPAGAIDGLMTGIPFVESMTNIIPTCGGTNAQSLDAIRRIGAQRIRHGGRAVTLRDHEGLIAEEFAEVGEVRCFSGIDRRGTAQAGCITAVVKPTQMGSTAYALSLCRRIENFLLERECCEPISGGRLAVIPARLIKVSAEISIVVKDIEKAAQTERDVISAVSRLTDTAASHIGVVPCENDIYAAVRGVANVAYAARVLLTGEYFSDGISLAIPLDRKPEYPFFLPVTGTHTVRIDGVSGM